MSTNEGLSIDLNIDRMRTVIYREMAEVCKPFYKRLEQLDSVELLLKEEQRRLTGQRSAEKQWAGHTPHSRGWATRKAQRAKLVRHAKLQKLLQSGNTTGIYAGFTQVEAIVDVVSKEPGLGVAEITQRLEAGGYRFKSSGDHVASMTVGLRHASLEGKIMQQTPTHEERVRGQRITYYPIAATLPAGSRFKAIREGGAKIPGSLTDRILTVIRLGPEAGMTRKEITQALIDDGYAFTPEVEPINSVKWVLQPLAMQKRIGKVGKGQGALFTRPKLSPIKN